MSAKYNKMTVAELKKELNKRGLEETVRLKAVDNLLVVSFNWNDNFYPQGLKAVLVKRLADDDEGGAEEAEAEPEVEEAPTGKRRSARAGASSCL